MSHINLAQAAITASSIAIVTFPVLGLLGRHLLRTLKLHVGAQTKEAVDEAVKALSHNFEARFDKNDASTEAAKHLAGELQLELAKQFGGNSGGIRQALNEGRAEISLVASHVDKLSGAFEQHMREGGK